MATWPEMKYVEPESWRSGSPRSRGLCEVSAGRSPEAAGAATEAHQGPHDGGVPFASGSDAPQTWNVPGFSVHRELGATWQPG